MLYLTERDTAAFESARTAVDIVFAGDSLTGWNNSDPAWQWPYRTWPDDEATSRRTIGNLGRMAQLVPDRGKRDYHNPRLKAFCDQRAIPLADICCLLRDEHFGDELHPNDRGAKNIAEAVFSLLPKDGLDRRSARGR